MRVIKVLSLAIIFLSYTSFAHAQEPKDARESIEATSQIQTLKEIVKKDPKNLPAWVELGNLYFDTDQPKEAIEAYSRYLAVKPDNADVRTDMGIMYRKLGQFDKAIEEFRKAAQNDPKHVNSRYNIGLVLLHDKQDMQGAIKAWVDYLKVDPNSERANRIRNQVESMKKMVKSQGAPTENQGGQQGGWINFGISKSEYVGIPDQKVWYNSDTIVIVWKATLVHIVKCNEQPRNSNSGPDNPMVELKDGRVVRGDWVGFEKQEGVWTWSIDNSLYNPIRKGSVFDVLLQSLLKQPRLGAKNIVK